MFERISSQSKRNKILDFLRGIAILIVLLFHSPDKIKSIFFWGWSGVDLFFVLSGFLVSGLLFKEYQRDGTIKKRRFLIRRGFKIYPSFYFFIAITVFINFLNVQFLNNPDHVPLNHLLAELFFLQNYFEGLAPQTWSLGVEEHFYFGLVIILGLLAYLKQINLKSITIVYLLSMLISASFRYYNFPGINESFDLYQNFYPTHLRFDALFFGVLLSYIYHHHLIWVERVLTGKRYIFLLISLTLFSPILFLELKSFLMNVFGLVSIYLGFGLLLINLITWKGVDQSISRAISKPVFVAVCSMGFYSYTIYLWHLGVPQLLLKSIETVFSVDLHYSLDFLLCFVVSIFLGIVFSELIEVPFLRFRDKAFKTK